MCEISKNMIFLMKKCFPVYNTIFYVSNDYENYKMLPAN